MGEFTQSLLKLTEFPFSYSFIGLLALIYGEGINLEELSFTKIGPLFILMGFVATTLSICDPMGAVQRWIIKGQRLEWGSSFDINDTIFGVPIHSLLPKPFVQWIIRRDTHSGSGPQYILDKTIFGDKIRNLFPVPYLFAIETSAEIYRERAQHSPRGGRPKINWDKMRDTYASQDAESPELNKLFYAGLKAKLQGLKRQTIKTTWITAEIDRITALIYFMLVVSLFIVATQLYPDFLPKFGQVFGDIQSTKLAILIFSVAALVAVIIMFILRIFGKDGLRRKALIAFMYLTALEAIKTGGENFKTTLESIERYLNNNDWTLAEYWVKRAQHDYARRFLQEVRK